MRFWSEGLGDRELVMSLGTAEIERKGDVMVLSGIVDSPAPWEYEVKIQYSDWETILTTAVRNDTCDFIARHSTLAVLISMAWSIVRFVALLSWFRLARIFRRSPRGLPSPDAAGGAASKV